MKLYEDGFQVIKKAITNQQAAAIRLKANDIEKWATVFSIGTTQDGFRLQAYVPAWDQSDSPLSPVEAAVKNYAAAYKEH
ncbi:uncharacterized protein IUM83_17931 [Phytophthora cinnamomi]|uniref:uncharacterized protein n=1 Tax=Phytophthora cinnamomi TaxID=4785 RepID=UPI003559FB33|nr:hypothetical protein IUM83_17931 [Phytophthora cinnamomi]